MTYDATAPASEQTVSTCDECAATFFYDPKHHECASKQRRTPAAILAESWVDECMRKQHEGIVR